MASVAKSGTPSLSSQTPPQANQISGLYAGEDIAAGDVCYIKSDGKIYQSNGTSANAAAEAYGIAVAEAKTGEALTLFRDVNVRYGSGLTPGQLLYVDSETAGGLADAATTGGVVAVAFAIDTTRIRFVGSVPGGDGTGA